MKMISTSVIKHYERVQNPYLDSSAEIRVVLRSCLNSMAYWADEAQTRGQLAARFRDTQPGLVNEERNRQARAAALAARSRLEILAYRELLEAISGPVVITPGIRVVRRRPL